MMKDRVVGHGTTTSMLGGPDHSEPENWRKQVRGKGKGGSRGNGRALLGEEAKDPELWPEEDSVWWSKGKRSKKGFSKGYESLSEGRISNKPIRKGFKAVIFIHTKARARIKGKGNEGAYPQSGFSPPENSVEERTKSSLGIKRLVFELLWRFFNDCVVQFKSLCFDSFSSSGTCPHHPTHVVLDLGCTRSIGSRTAIRRFQ